MINVNDFVNKNHVVVLGPNGSGKTRTSKVIFNTYKDEKCILFSAETIKKLVIVDSNRAFVGKNAVDELKKQKKIDEIRNSKIFKHQIKDKFGSSSIATLKGKSHFFKEASLVVKKVEELIFNFEIKDFKSINVDIDDIIDFDLKVDEKTYEFIKNELNTTLNIEEEILNVNDRIINKEMYDKLIELKTYTHINKYGYCLLCGNENSNIESIIKKNIEKYKIEENLSLTEKIRLYAGKISDENIENLSIKEFDKKSKSILSVIIVMSIILLFILYFTYISPKV